MPHIDELLGVATVAAAGLLAGIVVQPFVSDAQSDSIGPHADIAVTSRPVRAEGTQLVRLPTVEVVARRSVELARIAREEQLAQQCVAKDAARPNA
jgi:hypothetical protein